MTVAECNSCAMTGTVIQTKEMVAKESLDSSWVGSAGKLVDKDLVFHVVQALEIGG